MKRLIRSFCLLALLNVLVACSSEPSASSDLSSVVEEQKQAFDYYALDYDLALQHPIDYSMTTRQYYLIDFDSKIMTQYIVRKSKASGKVTSVSDIAYGPIEGDQENGWTFQERNSKFSIIPVEEEGRLVYKRYNDNGDYIGTFHSVDVNTSKKYLKYK